MLPAVTLAGVNDPDCHSADPPVVLLHGSFSTLSANFSALVPALRDDGRCVYGLNYGNGGIDPVTDSAKAVARLVTTVLALTRAGQADVVGYSQGGLVLRTALRFDGLAPKVRVAVLIAPSFHGTTAPLASAVPRALCPACADQAAGSDLLTRLDAGGDLDGKVRYAEISTADDTVVTPVSSQVPRGPADRVRSLVVQQRCPGVHVDHVALPGFPGVVSWVVAALRTDGRPPPSALSCG
jgi:triacylglycerol lipase